MSKVPNSLRTWFMIHFLADMLFGVPLLLLPEIILPFFGIATAETLTARLVGAALIGIGGVSLLMHNAGVKEYRVMLKLKLLWSSSALVGTALAYQAGTPLSAVGPIFAIFFVFFFIWLTYARAIRS